MRQIIDLTGWDAMRWIFTTGQSGQALSPHYSDLTEKWRDVKYEFLSFSRAQVDKSRANVLTLNP
ncbi:MAG: hypothetical protein DCC52_16560 [Chloroflexi bacterium]|nr:MAG: hypothetical protein DCC52_16560 [Chloroflexota bacterium]